MKARIKFRKYGVMKFIGHLDVMRYFQKAMRRADIPIAYTTGYSPHMIMSFAQPLGVGITSDGEYLDIELRAPVSSRDAIAQLNQVMVEGIDIVSFVQIPEDKKSSGMTLVAAADYQVSLLESMKSAELTKVVPEEWEKQIAAFMEQPQIMILKKTKRSEKEVDIKPMIYRMEVRNGGIYLFLAAGSEQNLKPDLVMEAYLRFLGKDLEDAAFHYHRLEIYAKNPDEKADTAFVSLDALGSEI